MLRAMTIHYNQHLHSNKNFDLFYPEKKIPSVKHLLSLKVVVDDNLFYNCHLRHLRLLKSLDLHGISLTDTLLNEISMLVHLRCLMIQTEVVALPPSFSNLLNLETLVVENEGSNMVLSPSVWSLAKLRNVIMNSCSISDLCIDEPTVFEEDSKLENLRVLNGLVYSCSKRTEGIFKRFPNLRSLTFTINEEPRDCSAEQICYPRLDVLNELEEVSVYFDCPWSNKHTDFHFPSSLKILRLKGFDLTSDLLSKIALLPNLQNLQLEDAVILGNEWDMEQVTCENLKYLRLYKVYFSEWKIGEESFPVLEELQILYCTELMEIPDSFGDIASLKSITLCSSLQLEDSALNIKEYGKEIRGDDKLMLYHWNI